MLFEISDTDPTRVHVTCAAYEIDALKEVPGFRFRNRQVSLPLSWATWVTAKNIFSDRFEAGENFYNWIKNEYYTRVEPSLNLRELTWYPEGDERLRPYQRADVAWIFNNRNVLLGNDLGTGKTPVTIMALKKIHEETKEGFPALVICPNSVKSQWEQEFQKWFPTARVSVVDGTAKERRDALAIPSDVYVINWESLIKHSRLEKYGSIALKRCSAHKGGDKDVKESVCHSCNRELNLLDLKTVIADEAHLMKTPVAKRTRAAWAIMHGDSVINRIGLTGTPVSNKPDDLWSIMFGIAQHEYPTKSSFVSRFCHQSFNFWSGFYEVKGLRPDTEKEFFKIFDPRYRRMPTDLVNKDLPPVIRTVRECAMSPKQRKAYKEMEDQYCTQDENGKLIFATNDLTSRIRLLQYASATCEVNEEGDVNLVMPSPKIETLLEVLEEASGTVAITSYSRKLLELASQKLEKEGIRHGLIVGGMTRDQRDKVLQQLHEGRLKAIGFTMQAGGTGLNLTECNTLIYLDRAYDMLLNYQSFGRVRRIGSEVHDSINVIDLIAPDTIEEDLVRAVRKKFEQLEKIQRDGGRIDDAVIQSRLM